MESIIKYFIRIFKLIQYLLNLPPPVLQQMKVFFALSNAYFQVTEFCGKMQILQYILLVRSKLLEHS